MSMWVRPSHEPIETSAIRVSHCVSGNRPNDLIMAVVRAPGPKGSLPTHLSRSKPPRAACHMPLPAPLPCRSGKNRACLESGRRCSMRFRHAEPDRFLLATTSKRTTCKVWFQHSYNGRHSTAIGACPACPLSRPIAAGRLSGWPHWSMARERRKLVVRRWSAFSMQSRLAAVRLLPAPSPCCEHRAVLRRSEVGEVSSFVQVKPPGFRMCIVPYRRAHPATMRQHGCEEWTTDG